MKTSKIITLCLSAVLSLGLTMEALAQAKASAQIPGRITRKDGTTVQGNIRWLPQAKKYIVSEARKGGAAVSTDVARTEVAKVETKKPERLDAAINAVKAGKPAAAIPVLQQIVDQYAMLGWDELAARYLAQAKITTGDVKGALELCEGIIKSKPEAAYLGEVAPVYWDALLKSDKKSKLAPLLAKAVSSGDHVASGSALIMRGNMLMEEKKPMDALKDGYLRVIILYSNVRSIQPEALFMGAQAFEALGQNANAEKLRSTLRSKYGSSEFARKL